MSKQELIGTIVLRMMALDRDGLEQLNTLLSYMTGVSGETWKQEFQKFCERKPTGGDTQELVVGPSGGIHLVPKADELFGQWVVHKISQHQGVFKVSNRFKLNDESTNPPVIGAIDNGFMAHYLRMVEEQGPERDLRSAPLQAEATGEKIFLGLGGDRAVIQLRELHAYMSGVKNSDPTSSRYLLSFVRAEDGDVNAVCMYMEDGLWNVHMRPRSDVFDIADKPVYVICPDSDGSVAQIPPG